MVFLIIVLIVVFLLINLALPDKSGEIQKEEKRTVKDPEILEAPTSSENLQ